MNIMGHFELPQPSEIFSAMADVEALNVSSSSERNGSTGMLLKVFWFGGSTFDAWLNIASMKVSQLLLTLPYSVAQMGLPSGIALELLQALMGCWSTLMINTLYLQYRHDQEKRNPGCFENHNIQMHEVLGGLLGPWWRAVGLFFNVGILFSFSAIQIVASGNIVYYISDKLERRTWTLIFGSCFALSILMPSAHNYRMWSFVGLIMITYTACYMSLAALLHEKDVDVEHTGPISYVSYFTGFASAMAYGAHCIPVEIMDAMWRPNQFKVASIYAVLYIFCLVVTSTTSVYWTFGDKMLLSQSNVFAVLPRSVFRDTAVVLMLLHQFIQFGMLALPLYYMLEKFFKVHKTNNYLKKTVVRIPIFLALWLVAIMFPFFGAINAAAGSIFVSWAYIIPCAATMATYRTSRSQNDAIEQPPFGISWRCLNCINAGIILWTVIMATGFGAWASVVNLTKQAHKFGLFAKCYQCKKV